MSVPVRRLGPSDIAAMRQLNQLFGVAFDDADSYAANAPGDAYLAELLSKDHVIALTAWEADTVTGGLVAYELAKFEMARSEIYIYDLAVAEAHRRKGIATALIEHLRAIAAARGAWVIYVQADYGDDPAIALYTRLGTREDVMHFDIAVPGGDNRN
ncbi:MULTISPECIES: AAC(3)-I family aminoglycoside N-acetyltransferase [Pseudomonadota]|uniref:AAC(3)-I family aminoglycoside N-acetyltransferase n=1 Tax=Pseudomonas aeruginosa TaxID=287 RepID=A0A844NVF7_PSEAI|nr:MULTISPECIES: AAC(3)-I family aminoglycoside N-acetyltransferase [Pseudomonadota]MCW3543581.1 AAC(3)-I family aminoglycoside N-acetyltransferase [Burkholderia cenocepacia]MDO5948304.1 AAC(3)-I family aminoglycoside N-acetyltransferase [Burkholderia cepacia]MUI39610.1 AAC(3)-I family aminoglycoside N-acetyltransferase [Pseudomonas aeruginosa]ULH02019.1 AAC(3)-I family aminoglycoside N-acetyltransferase [Aeromonas caviae]HBO7046333.1 AAC(3)-I family aminoglycoside N-acetyltransferase [Pseudom